MLIVYVFGVIWLLSRAQGLWSEGGIVRLARLITSGETEHPACEFEYSIQVNIVNALDPHLRRAVKFAAASEWLAQQSKLYFDPAAPNPSLLWVLTDEGEDTRDIYSDYAIDDSGDEKGYTFTETQGDEGLTTLSVVSEHGITYKQWSLVSESFHPLLFAYAAPDSIQLCAPCDVEPELRWQVCAELQEICRSDEITQTTGAAISTEAAISNESMTTANIRSFQPLSYDTRPSSHAQSSYDEMSLSSSYDRGSLGVSTVDGLWPPVSQPLLTDPPWSESTSASTDDRSSTSGSEEAAEEECWCQGLGDKVTTAAAGVLVGGAAVLTSDAVSGAHSAQVDRIDAVDDQLGDAGDLAKDLPMAPPDTEEQKHPGELCVLLCY